MSIQINSNVTLQVVLAAAPATNQLPCSASYVDQGGSGGDSDVNTNGTAPVTLVVSPAASVERLISNVTIPNADTASVTVTVNKVVSGTPNRLVKVTLMPGYHLFYDGNWRVMDPNGNFLCDVTVSSGSITSNQGTAAAITAPWPVELSNGTTAVGTSSVPLRIDPTGTTTQPVNLASLNGAALAGPTAWGVAPSAGAEVQNVNAYIVSGGSGGGNVNVTQWNTANLGSPSNYGTSPGAVSVIGVNAFVTNSVAVTGTFWQSTQPVSLASLPSLAAGANTIGAVTQASGPWTFNLTQVGGSAVSLGQQLSAASIPVVLASDNVAAWIANAVGSISVSNTTHSFGASTTKNLCWVRVDYYGGVTITSQITVTFKDGNGNTLDVFGLPPTTTTTQSQVVLHADMAIAMSNGSTAPSVTMNGAPTAGTIGLAFGYH